MDLETDLNSTKELLDDTLPGGIIDSVVQDDSEEEVFFGNISSKEKNGKNAKFSRRRTIGVKASDRRRSFEVSKSTSNIKSLNRMSSLYGSEVSIVGESEGFNGGFAMAEHEIERDGSPEGANGNLASENIGDVMDDSPSMEDGNHSSRPKRNQSLAYEGFRSDQDFSSSKFHSNKSFGMGKEREKDDAKCSMGDNVFLENNMDLDISYSPLCHSGNADSSKIFSEDGYLYLPQPVIEDSFMDINKSLSVNDDGTTEDPQNVIIDSNVSTIDVLQSFTENEILASDISKVDPYGKESFSSDHSFISNDENSAEDVISPANSPENVTFTTNSPDQLPRPVIQSDISTDQSECDVEDSFFSNVASNNISGFLSNVSSNRISGVEPFDVGCPKSLIHGSIQSCSSVSEFQRSKVSSVGATQMDKSQIEDSNLEPDAGSVFTKAPPTTEQEPILCRDETKFRSSTESCQREPCVDNESELNVSANESSALLLEISLEMGESLPGNDNSVASSWGSSSILEMGESLPRNDNSVTSSVGSSSIVEMGESLPGNDNSVTSSVGSSSSSSKHLVTHLQDCSINTKVKINESHRQKFETDEQEDEHSEIEDIEEQVKCHLDSNKQDWGSSEIENSENDEDENPLNDILDVDNDQLFDDSLYSLGDNTSRRLSTISNKICQTWKKREMKTRKTITANASVLESLTNSKDASLQEGQEEFDNTADEMALYEMFGEHYDKVVEEMTRDEKKKLRRKLDNRTEQDHLQTEEKLKIELAVSSSPSPTVRTKCKGTSPSPGLNSSSFAESPPLPSSISSSFKTSTSPGTTDNVPLLDDNTSDFSKPQDLEYDILTEQGYRHQPKSPGRSFSSDSLLKSPTHFRQPVSPTRSTSSESLFKSPTYRQPTTASLYKRVTPSPSPSKPIPWIPVSPHCNKSFIPVPVHSGGTPTRTPLKATPQLAGVTTRTPGSGAKVKIGTSRAMVSPSPLGTYLRDNKPPPLVQQVKAQSAVRDLESTLMCVENEAPETACPLPEARYYAPSLAKEHLSDATNKDYNIAEAYGQTNILAKVTRHVGRMKLTGIRWDEELISDQSSMRSPNRGQFGLVSKSVLKKTQRDSGTPDESMVDMSVLETVAIKKIARKDKKDNY